MIKSANTQPYHISLNYTCTMNSNGIHADDLHAVSVTMRRVNFGGDLCSPLYWGWGSCRENLLLLLVSP